MKPVTTWGLCVGALLLSGCVAGGQRAWNVDNCSAIRPGAIPAPNGTALNEWMDLQAARAEADDFVIYRHEWVPHTCRLGPYGSYHLRLIAERLAEVPFLVVIQPEFNDELNEQRRLTVVQALATCGVPNPDTRVVVAFPQAEGLDGREAARIYQEMIQEGSTAGGMGPQRLGGWGLGGGLSGWGLGGWGGGLGGWGVRGGVGLGGN
ncbi:MAG: hypothetical protein NZ700_08415 [Gemmataceae bacterium]|nr:hypothetical protein [Gemmataceae bacterium]MDW8263982.1 hypothetical protein [Gemmataceae bacterium]